MKSVPARPTLTVGGDVPQRSPYLVFEAFIRSPAPACFHKSLLGDGVVDIRDLFSMCTIFGLLDFFALGHPYIGTALGNVITIVLRLMHGHNGSTDCVRSLGS